MITIRKGVGGILRFRLLDAVGAAVTGLVDGDFTQRRYVTETDAWGDLSGTITEGEGGWYSIPITAGEADASGQAVAYFSDSTNESHVTFMIDDPIENAVWDADLNNHLNADSAGLAVLDILDQVATVAGGQTILAQRVGSITGSIMVGEGDLTVGAGSTDTDIVFNSGGLITYTEEQIVGCRLMSYEFPGSVPRLVTAFNVGTQTATVSPALEITPAEGIRLLIIMPVATFMDSPSGVPTLTAGNIADVVWDATLADHLDAGSTGEALDGAGGGSLTAADVADAVLEELISDHSGVSGSLADHVSRALSNTAVLTDPDGIDTGFDFARTLRKIGAAVVAKSSGADADGGTQVFRNLTDTSDEFTGAYDDFGNRTGITHHD